MNQLTLKSAHNYPIANLVGPLLEQEARRVKRGIEITRKNIGEFEAKFGTESSEFMRKYENDDWEESLDSLEWLGELRMLEHLTSTLSVLEDISIEN